MTTADLGPTRRMTDDLADVRRRVDGALERFVATATADLATIGPELDDVATSIRQFVGGGKRIRPLFVCAGWTAAGAGPPSDVVVRAAASLELVQVAALVHDDVIDRSDSRRGRPSVHRHFAGLHRDGRWVGPAPEFGVAAAILIGDLGLIWADAMLAAAGLSIADHAAVRRLFDTMRVEVIAGQYLDVHATVRPVFGAAGLDTALRVARLKSASYTVARPLQLGGTMAHAGQDVLAAYAGYGLALGEAFQLRDDLLGVFGRPSETGKPAGDDVREGKRTALLALAELRVASGPDRALLARVGAPDLCTDEIGAVIALIGGCGAVEDVEQLIVDRVTAARSALDHVDLDPDGRVALDVLADVATRRST